MNEEFSSARDAVISELAEAFTEEIRQGKDPCVEDWARRHPDYAGQIRHLFPALQSIEQVPEHVAELLTRGGVVEPTTRNQRNREDTGG